jgi:hypothetical protein
MVVVNITPMADTVETQKISIIVLSIAILAAVLVTSTVLNIVSSAAYGGVYNAVNVQPKTNEHAVTKPLHPQVRLTTAQCYIMDLSFGNPRTWVQKPVDCLVDVRHMSLSPSSYSPYRFHFDFDLFGCYGLQDIRGCHDWRLINNAPIEVKVQEGKDKHAWYTPGIVGKTLPSGQLQYDFSLCDDPKYSKNDHTSYPIVDFHGGKVSEAMYPGPYVSPPSVTGPAFMLKLCPADIHATISRTNTDFTNMSYHLDDGTFGDKGYPPKNAFNKDPVDWYTRGEHYGPVKGYVQYDVQTKDKKPLGTVRFYFSNPTPACSIVATSSDPKLGEIAHACGITQGASTSGAYVDYCVWYNSPGPTNCKATGISHTVLEKKPNPYVHTPSSGKTVLPHHQSHFTVSKIQTSMAVSTPKMPSSTSRGTSSKVTSGGAMAVTNHRP